MGYLAFVLDKYNVTNSKVGNLYWEGEPDELSLVLDSRSGPLSDVLNSKKQHHSAECFPPPAALIIGESKDEQKCIKREREREGDWQAMHEESRPGEKQRCNLKSHRPFLMSPLQRSFHTRRSRHYSSLNTLEGAGCVCSRGWMCVYACMCAYRMSPICWSCLFSCDAVVCVYTSVCTSANSIFDCEHADWCSLIRSWGIDASLACKEAEPSVAFFVLLVTVSLMEEP